MDVGSQTAATRSAQPFDLVSHLFEQCMYISKTAPCTKQTIRLPEDTKVVDMVKACHVVEDLLALNGVFPYGKTSFFGHESRNWNCKFGRIVVDHSSTWLLSERSKILPTDSVFEIEVWPCPAPGVHGFQ